MAQTAKKVNYYRLGLKNGICRRMEMTDEYLLTGSGAGAFTYLAPIYDSDSSEETWHRLKLSGVFNECKYEIYAAASDVDLRDELFSEEATDSAIVEILTEHKGIRVVGKDDILLHSIVGRYLYIYIRMMSASITGSFCIDGFSVEFPAGSFVEYLPEIYQAEGRDSFFERYMSVFQSVYEDFEQEIAEIPSQLDYDTTADSNLQMFTEWTGKWHTHRQLNPSQVRYILRNLNEIQSGRGTAHVLELVLKLVTGGDAFVLEYFKWHDWMKGRSSLSESYSRLFGENEDVFTILLRDMDGSLANRRQYICKIIEEYVPFGMKCNLVWLEWNSHMDSYCYLDANSRLFIPEQASTTGIVLGDLYTLG